jgi:hypothetical protein
MAASDLHGQDEYVIRQDSNASAVSQSCGRFMKLTLKKTQRLTKNLKKRNDQYLTAFDRTQEKLLNQLCILNERSAEYLRKDAQYSLNRFNNITCRESEQQPKGKYSGLTQRRADIESVLKVSNDSTRNDGACACSGLEDLKKAQAELNKELKRTEIIQGYISEREQFLSKTLHNVPEVSKSLMGVQKLEHYFGSQLKENLRIFSLSSKWETQYLTQLAGIIAPAPNMIASVQASPLPDWPNLKLEDLLSNAPEETKEAISQLKNPVSTIQNQQEIKKVQGDLEGFSQKMDTLGGRLISENDTIGESRNGADTLKLKKQKSEWKPNPLKTKRFVDRLIYTGALQVDRKTMWFPASGTITGGLGYQVHVRSTIGLGTHWTLAVDKTSERVGDGKLYKRQLLSNGFGGRIYADLQLFKPLYFQGSYECSQRAYSYAIQKTELLPTRQLQASCLLGLKIKYPARKNQRPTFEILYDFLHSQTGQPAFIMRTGIELKPKNSLR